MCKRNPKQNDKINIIKAPTTIPYYKAVSVFEYKTNGKILPKKDNISKQFLKTPYSTSQRENLCTYD